MKLLNSVTYLGPNIIAPLPLVHLRVAVEGPQNWPVDDTGQASSDKLLELLPGLSDHAGPGQEPKGFPAALRGEPGVHLGFVAARVATELQRRHDDGIASAGVRRKAGERIIDMYFRYTDPAIGLWAGQAAISLVLSLLPPEARPANQLPATTGPDQVLAIFERRRQALQLDQSTIALIREAERREVPWFVVDRAKCIVQLGQGRYRRRISQTITSTTSYLSTRLQDDKAATNRMLAEVRLPVPGQILVQDAEAAVQAVRQIGHPVVVKPSNGGKGKGITLEPADDDAVREAYLRASRFSAYVLVESFIAGNDHRVTVIGGRMIAAANRVPGAVTGDGRSTIAELVAELNRDPERDIGYLRLLNVIEFDAEADLMLAKRGYTRESVPPKGEMVPLRGTANISTGGTAIDVTDQVHPVNRQMLERTARIMGLDVVGIDFITPDISRPYREVGGAICEVNASPGLRAHLGVKGQPPDVVGSILDMLFPEKHNGRIPIAAITGTNGKTTTSRMLAHILRIAGSDIGVQTIGLANTDGVFVNGDRIVKGDLAGIPGANILLRDPTIEAAILETARGGLAKDGLAVDWCDVAAVLNVASDHIGYDGISNLDEMAGLKGRVAEAARKLVVLNADDERCFALANLKAPQQVCLNSIAPLSEPLRSHLAKGSQVITLEDSDEGPAIVLHRRDGNEPVIAANRIPATLDGTAKHNVQNAMAAVGLALGLGIARQHIAAALAEFRSDADFNLGRLNVFEVPPFRAVLDYAHNPAGVKVTCDTLRAMPVEGRRICVLANVGSRQVEHFAEIAAIVADQFDTFICSRNERTSQRAEAVRGFPSKEIPHRLAAALTERGVGESRIHIVDSSRSATDSGLQMAGVGDLLVLFSGEPDWCRDRIEGLCRKAGRTPD